MDKGGERPEAGPRQLPSFEEIVGFSEIPAADWEVIKKQYIGSFVAGFREDVKHMTDFPSVHKDPGDLALGYNYSPSLMPLLVSYFNDRVYTRLFDALVRAVPEFQELKDKPIQLKALGGAGADFLPAVDKSEVMRLERFTELSQRPDISVLLEAEYRPMQRRAQQMMMDAFVQISEEALLRAVDAVRRG